MKNKMTKREDKRTENRGIKTLSSRKSLHVQVRQPLKGMGG